MLVIKNVEKSKKTAVKETKRQLNIFIYLAYFLLFSGVLRHHL